MIRQALCTALACLSLAACTKTKPAEDSAKTAAAPAAPAAQREVNLYIWSNYTSKAVLDEFTRQTGIKVNESDYASNEELLAKLQAGATGYDIAVPSDYMVAVMVKLGMLSELDRSKLPNTQGLDPKTLNKDYDPGNKYSLPYGWGVTGIAVNRDLYKDPVASWGDLLQNDKVKGKVALLDDVREVVGAALKLNGFSLNSTSPAELAKAKATLAAAKSNVKAFNSTPADLLTSGDVVMAHMYSSDALVAARDSGRKIEFVIPKEGGTWYQDNAVLLKNAPHPAEAYALLNYLYAAANDADLVKRMLTGPVLTAAKDLLPKEIQDNPTLFPADGALAKCEMMKDLGETTTTYDRMWAEIKAASH